MTKTKKLRHDNVDELPLYDREVKKYMWMFG